MFTTNILIVLYNQSKYRTTHLIYIYIGKSIDLGHQLIHLFFMRQSICTKNNSQ